MNLEELKRYVKENGTRIDTTDFLVQVRMIVYGDEGYQSRYRIDDCECTSAYTRVVVSDRLTNQVVFTSSVILTKQTKFDLVA